MHIDSIHVDGGLRKSLDAPRAHRGVDDALAGRLKVLQETGRCCDDLPGLRAAAEAAGIEDALAEHAALADRSRLTAVALLARADELCNCEIQAALDLSHATVSHHMGILRDAGLVESQRAGKWVYYRLTDAGRTVAP